MIDIVTNESITALARTLGNKRGWKQQMPVSPPGLPAGGMWTQQRSGDVVRLRYHVAKGEKAVVVGEWRAADPPPMPHANGTGPKPTPPEPVVSRVETMLIAPAPLILIEPGPDGTRFNAYGLELPEIIEELRRALVHLVATSAGVEVISVTIPRDAAIAVERLPVRPQPKRRPAAAKGKLKRTVSYGGLHEDLDDIDADEDERW